MPAVVIASQAPVELFDASGNPILVLDGATITPASQPIIPIAGVDGTTVRTVRVDSSGRAKVQADALPLPAGAATDATLASIKDTAGVKKITDPLPAGTNEIGKVAQGTKASSGSDAWPQILYDAAGTAVAIKEGDTIVAATPGFMLGAKTDGGAVTFLTLDGDGRIRVSASTEATDPSSRLFAALEDTSGNINLYADGSVTPIEYTYGAHATDDRYITQIRLVINCTDIQFKEGSGDGTFSKVDALTNGLKLEVRSNSVTTELANFKRDEELLAFGGNDILDQTDTSDLLTATYESDGVVLIGGSADFVKVTVRDDLENAGHVFMACYVKGYSK